MQTPPNASWLEFTNYIHRLAPRMLYNGISEQPSPFSSHAGVFEPNRTAVVLAQPIFAIGKATDLTSFAFGRIRAVEEGNMLVTDVPEPMDLA